MGKIFNFNTREDLLERLRYIKRKKMEQEAAAKAEYQALQKETEAMRRDIYATIKY